MSTASAMTMDDMPSPIKPREDHSLVSGALTSGSDGMHTPGGSHTPRPPPSPLETEIDSEGERKFETQSSGRISRDLL